jgi:hypothetical protein
MRFRDMVSLDEAEVLAGRFKSVSASYYVLQAFIRKASIIALSAKSKNGSRFELV